MPNSLPFNVISSSELLSWRSETFWTKEPETIAWIEKMKESNSQLSHFIDVGANVGMYSLYAASVNSELKIISIEPAANNYEFLSKNIHLNNFQNRITLVDKPLCEKEGKSFLINTDTRPGSSGAQVSLKESSNSISVRAITGDLIVDMYQIRKAFLKIDIDGEELGVLLGFKEALSKGCILSILVECTDSNDKEIKEYLDQFGFYEDISFESIKGHSKLRRQASQKAEMNKIFSRKQL